MLNARLQAPAEHVSLKAFGVAWLRASTTIAAMTRAPGRQSVDLLIVTASNAAQAEVFTSALRTSSARHVARACEVLADPAGGRVGSGGASLLAIRRIRQLLGEGHRALVLHCGGESRRLPMYSATGKVFLPLPGGATFFDHVLGDMASLDWPANGGIVIGTGDTYLGLAADRPSMNDSGITGVGVPAPPGVAVNHGVFVTGASGEVVQFLHKPTHAALEAAGAIDQHGRIVTDGGVVSLPWPAVDAWIDRAASMFDPLARGACALDLYGDLLAAVGRPDGWPAPGGFFAATSPSLVFIHLGTTMSLLEAVHDEEIRRDLGLTTCDSSRVGQTSGGGTLVCCGSTLDEVHVERGGAYVEGCRLGRVRLEGENVLVTVPAVDLDIDMTMGACLTCFPLVGGRMTAVTCSIRDDFKTVRGAGGTYLDRPLDAVAQAIGGVWPDGVTEDLWHARLWRAADASTAVRHAMDLAHQRPVGNSDDRLSLAEISARIDHERLRTWREQAIGG